MKAIQLNLCLLCISILTCTACSTKATKTEPQPDSTATVEVAPQILPVTIQTLSGYFLKNTYKLSDDTTCILFPDKASFDQVLGVARTMNNKVVQPDFDKRVVAAVAMKAVDKKITIAISKAEKVGETINVYIESSVGESLTYTMQPLLLFSFPKEEGVSTVNFMMNGKLIQGFPLNVPAAN